MKSIIYASDSNNADASSIIKNQNQKDATFENERFQEEIKFLLKMLDNKGALDVVL